MLDADALNQRGIQVFITLCCEYCGGLEISPEEDGASLEASSDEITDAGRLHYDLHHSDVPLKE